MKWLFTILALCILGSSIALAEDFSTMPADEAVGRLLQTPIKEIATKSCGGYLGCQQQAATLEKLVRTDPKNYVQIICDVIPDYWRTSAEVPNYKFRMLCYANALYWLTANTPKAREDCSTFRRDEHNIPELCYELFDLKLTYTTCYNKHKTSEVWTYEKTYKDCFSPVLSNKIDLASLSGPFSGRSAEEVRSMVRPLPWHEIVTKSCLGHAGCISMAMNLEARNYTYPEDVIYNMCEQIPADYQVEEPKDYHRFKTLCYANAMYWVSQAAPQSSSECKSIDWSAPIDTMQTCVKAAVFREQYEWCRQTLPENTPTSSYTKSYSDCFYPAVTTIMRDF